MAAPTPVFKAKPLRALGFAKNFAAERETTHYLVAEEQVFQHLLGMERRRSERSGRPFILLLLDVTEVQQGERAQRDMNRVAIALDGATRESDTVGWHSAGEVIGALLTEPGEAEAKSVVDAILRRVRQQLKGVLTEEQIANIAATWHVYPDGWHHSDRGVPPSSVLYPDLKHQPHSRRGARIAKRSLDILGSLMALVMLAPVFLVIALLVKCSSKGPVFFRQKRIGMYGQPFTFLKFRSMSVNNDPKIHEEYVKKFINGGAAADEKSKTFKLVNDPRVTPIGRILRKTSLDELPQFINVLIGEMSLVGPRPPVPYELEAYDIWHCRRLLEAKPGITGPWQVSGRSRTTFDEMVRMDLQYAMKWSLWEDIRLLLATPGAVLSGDGAH